ncbi:ATP-binding protein [Leptolyngbya sp. CCY15150]|uniref:ATP-binding protein n=1 Tax=Leptolyngbya sp. CCY15150 TaxID=2767772 RepID=UPI001951B25B|nr:ATP-binding protein [Leptolyngbya sp. CCY15150]
MGSHPRRFKVRLYVALVLPFMLQVVGTVGVVGYLSFRNSQSAVYNLATQLMSELTLRIRQETQLYVEMPFLINSVNAIALLQEDIQVADVQGEYLLWQQFQAFPTTNLVYCATEDGAFMGVGYSNEDQSIQLQVSNANTEWLFDYYELDPYGSRARYKRRGDRPYDPRVRPWYQLTQQQRMPTWSDVYLDFDAFVPVITASTPVYDPNTQQLLGICATDFLLTVELDTFLNELQVGQSGETFIIEHTGNLVASSIPDDDILILDETNAPERLKAVDVNNELIRATSRELVDRFGDFQTLQAGQSFTLGLGDRGRHFVRVEPFRDERGLDWLVVVVIPERDFMDQIYASTWQTAALSLVALTIAITVGLITSRYIAQPILKLNRASKAITSGELDQTVEVSGIDELEQLGTSFNQMAQRLQEAIATLEQRVAERTADLEDSNQNLELEKERAESANRAKSAFIANMSHELRSPLNAIIGFSQLMMRADAMPKAQLDNAGIIYRSGDYLLTLINNILDLSKIEANKVILTTRDVDLHRLLNDLEDMLFLRAEYKGIKLVVDYPDSLPRYIHGDDVKLQQVLINLLSNAIKFTNQGSVRLTVTVQDQSVHEPVDRPVDRPVDSPVNHLVEDQSGNDQPVKKQPINEQSVGEQLVNNQSGNNQSGNNQSVEDQSGNDQPVKEQPINHQPVTGYTLTFAVADTGVGIAEEEIPTLFSAFNQTQSGRMLQEGTGLGLHISRKFVRLMGGDIQVESQPNVGTTVRFSIQVEPAQTAVIPDAVQPSRVIGLVEGQPTYRLLVVDDKDANRQLLMKLLLPIGFDVREASNGQEAIASWQDWQPHLIWMDVRMPVMDGYEATRRIKATPQGESTVIIALTASVLEEEQAVILSAGCDDFLRKPFKESTIFEAIAHHLGVQYRYAEEPAEPSGSSSLDQTWSDRLAELPRDWLETFYQTVLEADVHTAIALIEQLPAEQDAIAQPLATMVNQFQFEAILLFLESQIQDEHS